LRDKLATYKTLKSPEEITLAQEQLTNVSGAIEQARLRLDSIRLIVEGPAGKGEERAGRQGRWRICHAKLRDKLATYKTLKSPEEITLAQEQLTNVSGAIEQARLRLDSIRLIVEGPGGKE